MDYQPILHHNGILPRDMKQQAFKIRGMDCAEEIAILKRALGPLAGGEDRLAFDLINGKLTISGSAEVPAIEKAVAATGMRAIPWEEHLQRAAAGETLPWWRSDARAILCAISGLSL